MKSQRKVRGDASLFLPGVDRRDFIRRIGTSSAAAALALSAARSAARSPSTPNTRKSIMLDDISHATFAPLVSQVFEMRAGPEQVRLELVEARLLHQQAGRPSVLARRESFSLIFRAPREVKMPQQTYELTHAAIGTIGLFLVPIGPDELGMRYEAVFN